MTTAALRPIRRSASLVEEVCARLSRLIRSDLPNGDGWLPPERALAERLGVSRPVVREATKRLESQGLVEIRHGIGIRAVDKLHKPLNGSLELLIPDEEERLRQLNQTRMALEPEAARMAAVLATKEQLAAIQATHEELVAAPDAQTAIDADMAFHRAVAEASGNLMFRLILDSLADIGLASRRRTIGRIGKETAVEHHSKIIRAIERGQPAAAEKAMRFHIAEARKDMRLS
ncbi:MAG: FadR family transcriptional regulator [Verrucomicrobiae bacterium]|jgi:DNA-binding FadR family transcriptional regulator|nr:FadR family transcriptional regulator [Verrucomicrobiae bacterium]